VVEDVLHAVAARTRVDAHLRQIKDGRSARRFLRRGLAACEAEWKLLCGTHNLLKLWRHMVTQQAASPATT